MSKTFLTVCEAGTDGAIALFDGIKGKTCLYAVKKPYSDAVSAQLKEALKQLVVRRSNSSGGGDGFGGADKNTSVRGETEPLTADCAVVKNDTIVGGVVAGEWERSTPGDSDSDRNYIYLPIGAEPRCIEYSYHFQVYPFDGTSSEYRREVFAAVERITSDSL